MLPHRLPAATPQAAAPACGQPQELLFADANVALKREAKCQPNQGLFCNPTSPPPAHSQVDLAREATHLHAFNYNFRSTGAPSWGRQGGGSSVSGVENSVPPTISTRPAGVSFPVPLSPVFVCASLCLCKFPPPCCSLPHVAAGVSFPVPLYPLVQPAVLVETFEAGTHISTYVAR